jgi:hypothetical protein
VTSPLSTAGPLVERVRKMKRAAVKRDARMIELGLVRKGEPQLLFPQLFNETWRKPIVANFIENTAREFAEMVAPLPAFNCVSGAMRTEADKRRAATKNKIVANYLRKANLKSHMIAFADAYFSYGFAVLYVEPDYTCQLPMIRHMPSEGTYYDNDRDGNTVRLAHCYRETVDKLCDLFPEYAGSIRTKMDDFGNVTLCSGDEKLEVVQWMDHDQVALFLPERKGLVLARYENPLDCCMARVAERPGLFAEPTGQFDQVIWVQLARHRMAMLGLEGAVKAVGAPIAVPRDMQELAIGPDAVIVTDNPGQVQRVGLEVPQSLFAMEQTLQEEQRLAARFPEGRSGGMDASVITGRGVQALMGSFDTQIATAQTVIGECLQHVVCYALELDEKVWPNTRKQITGSLDGEPYDFAYTPAKDIHGVYACEVTYGFAAGLSPNAAIVMMLQLRGDMLVDRDTVRRNLPWAVDAEQMQRNIDVEQMADGLKQGLIGLTGGVGQLIAQGQDPRPILRSVAEIVKGRQNGEPIEELFIKAFAPEVQNPQQQQPGQDQGAGDTGAPAPPGGQPSPLDVQQPEVLPPIQRLIAGMRGGRPQLDASVSRQIPAG